MKLKILILLLIVFSGFSCERDDDGNNYFDFGKETKFIINQEYLSSDQKLKFSISEIMDSRCPTGAMCAWAGEVSIHIAIEKPAVDTIILSSYDKLIGSSNNYEFELGEVAPHPDIKKEIKKEDYIVLLNITK